MADKLKTLKLPAFMQGLSASQRAVVDSHLVADSPTDQLLDLIQEEWEACAHLARPALRRAIYRYKERHILPKQAQIVAKLSGGEMQTKLAALATNMKNLLDPIQAQEQLVQYQIERVEKLKATEAKMPTLLDSQSKNIGILSDMLFKLTQVHMDIGLVHKVPKKHQVSLSEEHKMYKEVVEQSGHRQQATLKALQFLRDEGVEVGDAEYTAIPIVDEEDD